MKTFLIRYKKDGEFTNDFYIVEKNNQKDVLNWIENQFDMPEVLEDMSGEYEFIIDDISNYKGVRK